MRWQSGRRSGNIVDLRGKKAAAGGGLGLLALGVVVMLMGGNPTALFVEGIGREIQMRTQSSSIPQEQQAEMMDFVSVVLAGTEDTWHKKFAEMGATYSEPQLVVFSGAVNSQCGNATSAVGPFYCPLDQTIYLDLEFFHDLETQFGAPGDFAQAYVIAHEVGHHVENLMGILDQAQSAQARVSKKQANAINVNIELMADCLAGIWGHETQDQNILESGDLEEALNAATQIGDDTLQKKSQGQVVPDSFTHGSAKQRYEAFKTGFESGDVKACSQKS